jgi:proline iminopeptidase
MTWENLTADAEALRQALGFDKWAVLGQSFGGNVALEYALRYPSSLSQLILMDTGGDQRWVQRNAPELLAKRGYSTGAVQAARRFYSGQVTPGEFFPTVMRFARAYNYRSSLWAFAREAVSGFRAGAKMRPEALIFGYSQILDGWTVMNRLNEIQAPTLVLAGRDDFLFPPEHEAILADRLPNAQLELIEYAGHNPQMERPAQVIEIIRRFLISAKPAAPNLPMQPTAELAGSLAAADAGG